MISFHVIEVREVGLLLWMSSSAKTSSADILSGRETASLVSKVYFLAIDSGMAYTLFLPTIEHYPHILRCKRTQFWDNMTLLHFNLLL